MTCLRRCLSLAISVLGVGIAVLSVQSNTGARTASNEDPLARRVRRPIALALAGDGAALLVANGRSGTISEVDLKSEKVASEHEIAKGLCDFAALPDGNHFVAIDSAAGDLLLLEYHPGNVSVKSKIAVGPEPTRVAVFPNGKACAVTSQWRRSLSIVDIQTVEPALKIQRTVELPFQPREVLPIHDGKALLVADAFGGKLAVVDPAGGTILSVRELAAHNIRGLTATHDGRSILLAHQATSRLANSSFDDVHWGALIKNQLVTLRVDTLLDPKADLFKGALTRELDEVNHAAGDPEDVSVAPGGNAVVALAGVGEIAILGSPMIRVSAGTRPTSLAINSNGRFAYVADSVEDSIAIVPLEGGSAKTLSLGPKPESTAIERGETLFTSAKLSHGGWMSCRSCHAEGHTNGFSADTFGDGSYGAPKLIPSLRGVGKTAPYGWLGNFATLEDQVRASIETTLRGLPQDANQVADLTAYLRSLNPPAAIAAAAEASRGEELFRSKKCATCHAAPEFTSEKLRDVGLTDESGRREFNPPSLRGVGQRMRFLHDGRAKSIESVLLEHHHPPGANLSEPEVSELSRYLRTL